MPILQVGIPPVNEMQVVTHFQQFFVCVFLIFAAHYFQLSHISNDFKCFFKIK